MCFFYPWVGECRCRPFRFLVGLLVVLSSLAVSAVPATPTPVTADGQVREKGKAAATPAAVSAPVDPDGAKGPLIVGADYAARSAAFIAYLAQTKARNPNFPKDAMAFHAARLATGTDLAGTVKTIDGMLDATLKAKPDPFNLHAVLHAYFLHRQHFTPAMTAKVKKLAASWSYSKAIGVSLNYELMRDASGYLAAQEWPDLTDAAGNNADQIKKNCAGWLWRIFRETPDRNASEYDAPIYYGTDFAPCRMFAEFAADEPLRHAAEMTLTFMLVQTGAHWHRGYHISSAGRGKYWGSLQLGPDSAAPTNAMAYLLFGGARPANLSSAPQAYWLAHPGRALPLDWLPAWQEALPENRTVIATHLWDGHKIWVRKMAWFTDSYGLASQREDGTPDGSYLFKEYGWILETSPLEPFAGGGVDAELQRFAEALTTRTKLVANVSTSPPGLSFTPLSGQPLTLRWKPGPAPFKNEATVDGKPIPYSTWQLLDTPTAHQPNNGPLTITMPDRSTITYDFKKWTVTRNRARSD